MKAKRLHDKIYLRLKNFKKIKSKFVFLEKILKKRISKSKNYTLLDIGCANGELLNHLNKKFRNLELYGTDIRSDLIIDSKKRFGLDFKLRKIDYSTSSLNKKFDFVVCSGVICIQKNLNKFLKNVKKNLNRNSILYIFDNINDYDFDVITFYKDLNSKNSFYEIGWNIWSLKTIKKIFSDKKVIKYPVSFKFNIKKNKKDFLRSWTIDINKRKFLTNGLNIIQNQMWLEIRK